MIIRSMTPSSFDVYIQSTLMFVKNYAHQPHFKLQMQEKLKDLENQTLFKILPFELFFNLSYLNLCDDKLLKFFNKNITCPFVLCSSNKDFVKNFENSLQKDDDHFKILMQSLTPVHSEYCNHCNSQISQIPQYMAHNKNLQKLFLVAG